MIFIIGGTYAGKETYAREAFGANVKIIRDIHLRVKEAVQNGKNPCEEMERLFTDNRDAVFISDEIGCGIVPMDRFGREWREETGRVHCYLAEKAERVIRVVCGIGTVIK